VNAVMGLMVVVSTAFADVGKRMSVIDLQQTCGTWMVDVATIVADASDSLVEEVAVAAVT
jgi:hypothetical protein